MGVDVGTPIGTSGEVRLGVNRGRLKLLTDTSFLPGSLLVPEVEMGGVQARLRVDTLDNLRFPRAGYAADLQVYASRARFGATDNYTKASSNVDLALSQGAHSVQIGLRAAKNLGTGELPAYETFSLGGFLQMSGYRTGELLGQELTFGRVIYNYRVSAPGLFDGAYVGVSYETGRIGDTVTGADRSALRHGAALYFAFDSPIGPVYVAYGRGDGRRQAVYLFVGQP
jgi:NTE family protein